MDSASVLLSLMKLFIGPRKPSPPPLKITKMPLLKPQKPSDSATTSASTLTSRTVRTVMMVTKTISMVLA